MRVLLVELLRLLAAPVRNIPRLVRKAGRTLDLTVTLRVSIKELVI